MKTIKMLLVIFSFYSYDINAQIEDEMDFCANLECDVNEKICGLKPEGEGFRIKMFQSECDLLKYHCKNMNETASVHIKFHEESVRQFSEKKRNVKSYFWIYNMNVDTKALYLYTSSLVLEKENLPFFFPPERMLALHVLSYDIINIEYCLKAFKTESNSLTSKPASTKTSCKEHDCSSYPTEAKEVCSIRNDGEGFKVRLFKNKCELWKYNCENQIDFTFTDLHICSGMQISQSTAASDGDLTEEVVDSAILLNNETESEDSVDNNENFDKINSDDQTKFDELRPDTTIENDPTKNEDQNINPDYENHQPNVDVVKEPDDRIEDNFATNVNINKKLDKINNLIVVRSSLLDFNHINESIEHFFAATHVFDLPVKEMDRDMLNETTRRRLIKVAGPIKVFVPWVTIPKNISDDFDHTPTLSTCYHKCPRKCPSTYAPVCGVPGIVAREPSLMFQNHCFMDVAQCKMFWENKSPTALSSSYVESSFLFCLGDEMNGMYRFLPLIRTLQHMGRLRKKGHYHYRFKNMKFFNNLLSRQPKFMG